MRRSLWTRTFAACLGVWISLSLSEPAFLHACPVHDAAHATAATHHAQIDAKASTHGGDAPDHASHRGCTCIGQCCAAAPLGLVTQAPALAFIAVITPAGAALPAYAYVPVAAQHVLPFQNGPPTSV